jgi:Glycosyltransferase family 87
VLGGPHDLHDFRHHARERKFKYERICRLLHGIEDPHREAQGHQKRLPQWWFQARIDEFGFAHVRDIHNTQAPTTSLMMAPIAWMSPARARVVWLLLSVVLWIAGLGFLARGLGLFDGPSAIHPLLVLAAVTTGYLPIRDNLRQGQCYTLIFFLLCLVFFCALRSGSRGAFAAGVPLGLMLVLKTAGVWLWPLLLLSRRWPTLLAAETVTSLMGHLFVFDAQWSPAPIANAPALATFLKVFVSGAVFVPSLCLVALATLTRLHSQTLAPRLTKGDQPTG